MAAGERNEPATQFRYSFINYSHLQVNSWERKRKKRDARGRGGGWKEVTSIMNDIKLAFAAVY